MIEKAPAIIIMNEKIEKIYKLELLGAYIYIQYLLDKPEQNKSAKHLASELSNNFSLSYLDAVHLLGELICSDLLILTTEDSKK